MKMFNVMKKITKILLGLIFKKDKKNMTPKFQIKNLEDDIQEQPKVLNKEDGFSKEKDSKEDKPVEITDLSQYKRELEKGTTNFDFSKLNLIGEDIQGVNLENLGLNINLREIFVPYNGAVKIGNNILSAVFSAYSGDYYLRLEQAKLGGNNVIGDLTYFEGNQYCSPVYIWYSEETFDEKYKLQYPQFFLSKEAPEELREKYYNPRIAVEKVCDIVAVINDLEDKYIERKILKRHTLTLDDYLKYYKFLKGKYLGNFSITDEDLMVIEIIEKYGLEKKTEIFEQIDAICTSADKTADLEEVHIEELSDKGARLVLELKFNNEKKNRENK